MELGRAEVGDSPAHMTCLKPLTTASSGFQGKAHNSGVQAFLLRELSSLQGASQWLSGIKKKKNPPAMQEMQEMWVRSLGGADPLEESLTAHSSIPAWSIPWTGEPGGLLSSGSQSVRQD